ncbi:hypothetical protein MKX03_036369 [Papaver bracteatum]|nr:hypothetical protein MKX03_036369 [Papaver bracteatum]
MAQDNSYEEARRQRLKDNKRRFEVSHYITTRVATEAERSDAVKRAMSFQSGFLSGNSSFVKSLSHSHVSGQFLLKIPSEFRDDHLSKETKVNIVLEDEEGSVYETNYNGVTGFLSTGWKVFSMDHKLDDGDALAFELIEPTRLKVHIFKVSNDVGETSYIATRVATEAERSNALKRAMSFQSSLLSGNPSFIKSISPSHVSEKFLLMIPLEFRRNHLSKESKLRIMFKDEEGLLYGIHYNGLNGYFSTGWKIFSTDHKLDDGDALVMELIEPTRFKVHIFKVPNNVGEVKVDQLKKPPRK